MVGYEVIEKAVRERIVEHVSPLINDERCQIADIDKVFTSIASSEKGTVGCILDFSGGELASSPPFTGYIWQWTIAGYFIIKFDNDMPALDATIRELVQKLSTLFAGHERLGGASLVRIGMIDQPEPGEINDMPFFWLFFTVEALDK